MTNVLVKSHRGQFLGQLVYQNVSIGQL